MKALGVGFLSFLAGIVVWHVLYYGLLWAFHSMRPLNDQEETAFKVAYVAISVISAALAFGFSWLGARRTGASRVSAIILVFLLTAAVTVPIAQFSSLGNDCSLNVENFPFRVGGCD